MKAPETMVTDEDERSIDEERGDDIDRPCADDDHERAEERRRSAYRLS